MLVCSENEAMERVKRVLEMAKKSPKGSYIEYEYYKDRIGRIHGLTSSQYQEAIRDLARVLKV